MSSTEQKIEKSTEIKKDEDVIALLTKVSVQNSEGIKKLTDKVDAFITKLEDSNPVAHGYVLERKPKSTDEQEIGDPTKATNAYGQSRQASIVNEGNVQSDSDKDDLSMEEHKKSAKVIRKDPDPDPDPDPEPDPDTETKKSSVKKSVATKEVKKAEFDYIHVEAVRPAIFAKTFTNQVTGWQLIKAVEDGWGKKYTDADDSMQELYKHLMKGEYGSGAPGEFEDGGY